MSESNPVDPDRGLSEVFGWVCVILAISGVGWNSNPQIPLALWVPRIHLTKTPDSGQIQSYLPPILCILELVIP